MPASFLPGTFLVPVLLCVSVTVAKKSFSLSRSDPIPQRWKWITGNARFIEKSARDQDMRVVDISVLSEFPPLFAAVLAENRGEQMQEWFLYTGLNSALISRRYDKDDSRLTYVKPYGANTGTTDLVYAAIAIRDKKTQSWGWSPKSASPPQPDRKTLSEYSSIGSIIELGERFWVSTFLLLERDRIRKRSVLARKTAGSIRKAAKSRRVIIVDIHRHEDGRYSAILEKLKKPVQSYWLVAVKPEDIDAEAEARSARVYDLEPYRVARELVYDVLMVQN